MRKESEQDYIISGETTLEFSFSKYIPYFDRFRMYENTSTQVRYWLPVQTLVQLFLRSLAIEIKTFSIRINKIKILHFQPKMESTIYSGVIYSDIHMAYHPICCLELRMGMKPDYPTYLSPFVFDDRDPNVYGDLDTKFFTFMSDPDSYEWDFTKGTYFPGYGSFIKYDSGNIDLNGGIVCKGFYESSPGTAWVYRNLKILFDVTIRDLY